MGIQPCHPRYAAGDLGNMALCAVQPPSKQIMEEQKEARGQKRTGLVDCTVNYIKVILYYVLYVDVHNHVYT